jgi:hypothetical protein
MPNVKITKNNYYFMFGQKNVLSKLTTHKDIKEVYMEFPK